MPSQDHIVFVDFMVETLTIEYCAEHPHASYEDYVRLLGWYWRLPERLKSAWVFDWIKALAEG